MTAPARQTISVEDLHAELVRRLPEVLHRWAPPAPGSFTKNGQYFTLNPGRADRSVGSFKVNVDGPDAGKWHDFATRQHGDLIDLIALQSGCSVRDAFAQARAFLGLETETPQQRAAREAATAAWKDQQRAARRADDQRRRDARRRAHGLWLSGQERLAGTPVEDYLRARAIDLAALGRQPRALRFHPECWYVAEQIDPETGEITTARRKLPAMLAAITDLDGRTIGCHRTYLARGPGGIWAKAPVPDAKKVLGEVKGGTIRLSSGIGPRGGKGGPLNDCPPGTRLLMAEGIETALSAVMLRPDARVVAAVSLGNMAAARLPANVAELVLISDGDDHAQAQAAFSAAITTHSAAGRCVRVWRPAAPGEDLNDALRRAQAQQQGKT
jgi:hypothetical protein